MFVDHPGGRFDYLRYFIEMPALELRDTILRFRRKGSSDVYHHRVAEAVIGKIVAGSQAPRDPYGGVTSHKQTAWSWQIQTFHELADSEVKLLGIKGLGSVLEPDADPPSYDIEVTTPDGIHRRYIDAQLTSIIITSEERRIVSVETSYTCRIARQTFLPMEITQEEVPHRPISGIDCSVELDDITTDCYANQVTISRPGHLPTNYDTHGEARGFNYAGRWDIEVSLELSDDDLPTEDAVGVKKTKLIYGGIGSITVPTTYYIKPGQTLVADDWDSRQLMGRGETAPGKNLAELLF